MKKVLFIAGILSALLILSACNTVRGVGRDVQAVGDGVRNATD